MSDKTVTTLKLGAAFIIGIVFICSVQYFSYDASKWWSRMIYDCGARFAHDTTGNVDHLMTWKHKYGVCYD